MPHFKRSRYTVDVPIERDGETMLALYQTMTRAFILIPERHWSYIVGNPLAPADPGTIDMLYEEGFLVRDGVDETALFENWRQRYVHDFSTIRSKVLVTRKCNNRCRYCIIDPESKEMSPGTARDMDRFYLDVIREKKPDRVEDDYLGGEPLLNPGIIMESASRRFYFCQGKGIEYGFIITTNGTLLREPLIGEMKEIGLTGIRVSMAGPASLHDRLRPSKNNGKTYDLIMKNLQSISGLVPIFIECQFDSGSRDFLKVPEMLDDFSERHIAVEQVAFTPILRRRGESPYDCGMGDPRISLYLKGEAEKRGYPMNDEAPSNSCMADFRSRFIFDTDGSMIPCPSLQGAEMAYGHVRKGIDFVSECQLLTRALPEKCLKECPILPICMGGCRLQALVNQGNFGGVDCHYETYRLFLEDYILKTASAEIQPEVEAELRKAA